MNDVKDSLSQNSAATVALPNALARSLVKQCREHTEGYVRTLFDSLAKQLDEDLLKLVEKTQEEEKAQRYTDAMIKLRSERRHLTDQFRLVYSQLLSQALNPDGLGGDFSDGSEGGLSLVDEAQLEESLVVEQITAKIFEQYSDELYALEQRLRLMLPGLKMDEGKIPFGSTPICKAVEALLQPLEFEIKVKLAIYRSLERTLLESMGGLFDELNELLCQAGVLPEIKRKAKKSESSEPVRKKVAEPASHQDQGQGQGQGQGPGEGEGGTGGGDGTGSGHGFQGIQQLAGLFAEGMSGDPAKQEALVATPVTPQLVEALSGLQVSSELLDAGAGISGEEFKARIKAQLSEREGAPAGGISQLDDETIDVISMIFDDLMEDENLPDFIKALLGRLQIPVLKVAIIDRVFFSEKDHPARMLLNELTIAGQIASVDDGSEKSAGIIYKKIESVVMRLMREFKGDLAIFESCLVELRAFMAEQEAGFQQAQQEIGELAQKNGFEAKAKKNVAEEIAGRLLNRVVPLDVKEFLMGSWRQVLSTIILNEGEESVALQQAEQVIDDLIWSVEPLKNPEAKKKLLLVVPLILDALKDGLVMIDYTEAQIQDVNQMLERYHIENIKSGKPAPPVSPIRAESKSPPVDEIDQLLMDLEDELGLPADKRIGSEALSHSSSESGGSDEFEQMMKAMGFDEGLGNDDAPHIDDRYTVLVGAMEEGMWVELLDEQGESKRTKLAWKGDEFTKYAFVNWRYKVVAEKSYYGLADEFRQGNAAIIEDLPLFDRAFDSVFTKIMQLAG